MDCSTDRSWRRASIQRVVPREETLSHLIPNCYSIVIAPIYLQYVYLCVWLKVGDDQGSSLGLRFAVSWDLVFDTEAPPREGAGPGVSFLHTEVHWCGTWSKTATSCRSCHTKVETGQHPRTRMKELNGDEGCARRTVKELYRVDVTEDPLRPQGAAEACRQESAEE